MTKTRPIGFREDPRAGNPMVGASPTVKIPDSTLADAPEQELADDYERNEHQ